MRMFASLTNYIRYLLNYTHANAQWIYISIDGAQRAHAASDADAEADKGV